MFLFVSIKIDINQDGVIISNDWSAIKNKLMLINHYKLKKFKTIKINGQTSINPILRDLLNGFRMEL